jgi:hypothetical protein
MVRRRCAAGGDPGGEGGVAPLQPAHHLHHALGFMACQRRHGKGGQAKDVIPVPVGESDEARRGQAVAFELGVQRVHVGGRGAGVDDQRTGCADDHAQRGPTEPA